MITLYLILAALGVLFVSWVVAGVRLAGRQMEKEEQQKRKFNERFIHAAHNPHDAKLQ